MKKAEIDATSALGAYLGMQRRSLRRLVRELAKRDMHVSLWTVKRWSVRHEWQAEAAAYDARRAVENDRRMEVVANYADGSVSMAERHAGLGRQLQELAREWAQTYIAEGYPATAADVARWAEAGVRIERLAMGEATSRTEVNRTTYNTVLVGVLELFKTVVQPAIPGDARELVAREFADGVNAITDKVLDGDARTVT